MICCVASDWLGWMDGWEQKKEEIQPLEAKRANEQRRNAEIEKVGRQADSSSEDSEAGPGGALSSLSVICGVRWSRS